MLILTLLYLAVRLPWVLTLPHSQAPDEPNHFWVTHFLVAHLRLPTAAEVFAGGTPAEYGSLPQFGYIPHVLVSLPFPESMMPFVSRFGSLIAGWPTVWAAHKVGREIFTRSNIAAVALPLLIVFHPQLVFTQSYTNTDATTISLTSLAVYLVLRSIKIGLTVKSAMTIGFLLAWTALSKHTGLSLVPALGLGLLAAGFLNRETMKQQAVKLSAAAAVFLACCAWWFIRNYHEFNGDWLGSRTMYETWAKILPRQNGKVLHPWPALNTVGWWRYVFFDYWALFGYMDRYIWRPLYVLYGAFTLLALGGWASALARRVKPPPGKADESETNGASRQANAREHLKEPAIWLLLVLCPFCNLLAMIAATLMNVTGPHGRYLFPSIIPLTALIIAGFYRLGEKNGRIAVFALLTTNILVTVGSWMVFYPPGTQ